MPVCINFMSMLFFVNTTEQLEPTEDCLRNTLYFWSTKFSALLSFVIAAMISKFDTTVFHNFVTVFLPDVVSFCCPNSHQFFRKRCNWWVLPLNNTWVTSRNHQDDIHEYKMDTTYMRTPSRIPPGE